MPKATAELPDYKIGDKVVYTPRADESGFKDRAGATGVLTFVFKESTKFAGRIHWDDPKYNGLGFGYDDLVYHAEIEKIHDDQ